MRSIKHSLSIQLCCLLGAAVLSVVLSGRALRVRAAPISSAAAGPVLSEPQSSLGADGRVFANAANEAAGVVVVSSSYFRKGDSLYVVGEVRNDTATNVSDVVVEATYFDDASNVLDTGLANSEHQILIPGQKSPFLILDAYPTGLVTYTLAIMASPTDTMPVPLLYVLPIRDLPIAPDGLSLVGEVQNTQAYNVSEAKLIVTLRDEQGKVINVQSDYVFSSLLPPGQKSPFRVVLDAGPTDYISRTIGTDTRQSTAVPPDLHSVNVTHHLNGEGALHWVGKVENRGSSAALLVKAMVTLYDDEERVVNVGVCTTNPSTVEPGGEAEFDIVVAENFASWTHYDLYPPEDAVPTPTSTRTPTATQTPTPTSTPTATGIRTATPTPTEGPPGDLWMAGHVYDAATGPTPGISGAAIAVLFCRSSWSKETHSGSDGYYELLLPADWLNQCTGVTLLGVAAGYQSIVEPVTVADLRAEPQRDFAMVALATLTPTSSRTATPVVTRTPTSTSQPRLRAYLPLVLRNYLRR